MNRIGESELILNPDGSIFHLRLKPENIGDTIILVGDQGRVETVSAFFDKVEFKIQNREFLTHTGYIGNKKITALSTGIGTDNIDIVINELDALVNIDLEARTPKSEHKSLNFVRIGTSGSLQEDIPVDSFVLSEYGLGFDGLLNFYSGNFSENDLVKEFIRQTGWKSPLNYPYIVKGSEKLTERLKEGMHTGITATACGFYGPQGRQLRLKPSVPDLNERLTAFSSRGTRITNFEMETSALFGLSELLGHEASTVCAIIANRIRKEYSKDYKIAVKKLIGTLLERLTG